VWAVSSRMRRAIGQREEGFTLIEILVVMIIIGILAAIAIPIFLSERNNGNDATTKSDVKNASTSEEAFFTENGKYTSNTTPLATPGTATSALPGWAKSGNTSSVTFTVQTSPDAYTIVGVSKSGVSFCVNSQHAGAGVVTGSTC
jgi:type IV pilus assembly protein PilA